MTHLPHENLFTLAPETVLQNGAFVLREVVGRGGTSFTYRAFDVRLAREVAIKEFFPPGSIRHEREVFANNAIEYSTSCAAFIEEARALARFDHPHIVRVFAVFEENNSAYIVEEFLHGHTLQHALDSDGALALDDALETLRPVCDAIETLHKAGLIHGDIKPANIFRTKHNRVVLLDFGLTASLPSGDYATTLLAPQRGVGTAGYAPIEQYSQHGALSPATDVYAFAATLWHLITNQLPPDAPGRASGIALPDIRALAPHITENVVRALEHGLAMNANNRPQNVEAWWRELSATETLTPAFLETGATITSSTRSDMAPSSALSQTLPSQTPPSQTPSHAQLDLPQHSVWGLVILSCSLFALMIALLLL